MLKSYIKWLIPLVIILLVRVEVTYAHTQLVESSPSANEVVQNELTEIELMFGTVIEEASSFKILNSTGEEQRVSTINIEEDKMTGEIEGLSNGSYIIYWEIVGADGHIITGEIPFTLDVMERIKKNEPESASDLEEENPPYEENDTLEENNQQDGSMGDTNQQGSSLFLGVGAIVLLFITFLFVRKK
ncbi:copper resistance CopC family protein [Bacillus coahuilensis]|uniref:copper resistance CopC family protein n=1 Tax=Bacillus coahuilensis TaxID=408580 RepID=UPI0001850B6A|nr:copper resistance CopC family protein [Bacillus coahuilensis]